MPRGEIAKACHRRLLALYGARYVDLVADPDHLVSIIIPASVAPDGVGKRHPHSTLATLRMRSADALREVTTDAAA
jgi:hypothetical protein